MRKQKGMTGPVALEQPMYVYNIRRVEIDKKTGQDEIGNWWGTDMPVYRYDLLFKTSLNRFDTMYVRARSPANALTKIKQQHKNIIGVYDP
jgi:hypothetical protein